MNRGERQVLDSRINLAPAYLHNFVWQCIDVWSIKWLLNSENKTILANNLCSLPSSRMREHFMKYLLLFCVKITSGLSCVCSFRKTQSFMLLFQIILFFFSFIFISWRLITSQHCSGFCHTLTWISHGVTHVPHPDTPLPPPSPPDPSGSSQCTRSEHLSHASNLGWWSVSL